MAAPFQHKTKLAVFAGRSLVRYIRFVYRNSEVVIDPPDARERLILTNHPFILAMWHGQFLMMPHLHIGGIKVSAILARHGDAEALGDLLSDFNIELVRGSGAGARQKDRGGAYALRTALRLLKSGSTFSMTADVPGDLARRGGEGIVTLARLSGRPIMPFAVASSRYVAFRTWSRMTLNLPFGKLAYAVGPPIWVPAAATPEQMEHYRQAVEVALDEVTARAYRLAGSDPKRATPRRLAKPSDPPAPIGLAVGAYRAVTKSLKPITPFLLKMRERQGKEDASRRDERFGIASRPRPDGLLAWVHAASVGEANAVLPLIAELTKIRPGLSFLLTTGTLTSARLASARLGPNAVHQFVPLDVPEFAERFFDHWRPDLAVITESEIWPNLLIGASDRGIPLALVNARLSARSYSRWTRTPKLAAALFSRFDAILAQNDRLARSFRSLGARRVLTIGNLKIDAPPPPVDLREVEKLRSALAGRPVFMAASTHEGEDEIVAEAHRKIVQSVPGLCTIIAPRHPERGKAISDMLRSRGLPVAQRSHGRLPSPSEAVYVADTIGELGTLYAVSPVAFVGGSLIARGGQNPIEAIRHGTAVLTGPHWENFKDFYRALLRHRGAREVGNAEALGAAAAELIASEPERERMKAGAASALNSLGGALERTAIELAALLPPDEGARRAS